MIYIIGCILLSFIVWFCWFENNALKVTQYQLEKGLKKPIRIVHLSDLHAKKFGKDNIKLKRCVMEQNPDFIVFTGDFIVGDETDLEPSLKILQDLCKKIPVFYVFGNHEHRYQDLDGMKKMLSDAGVTVLCDEIVQYRVKGTTINLLGLDEDQGSLDDYKLQSKGLYRYRDYSCLFHQLEKTEGLKLVLSHYPQNFALIGETSYNQFQYDLMFAGHAHGGQFILPFIGGLYAPGQGVLPKYYSGFYGDSPKLLVSRGLGNSSFPQRLFNRPDIVSLTID